MLKATKVETFEGVTTWNVTRDGVHVGELEKQRPARRGTSFREVRDNDAPWVFTWIPEGGEVRRLAAHALRTALKEIA